MCCSACPDHFSCLNGGTCVDRTCSCPSGFSGLKCHIGNDLNMRIRLIYYNYLNFIDILLEILASILCNVICHIAIGWSQGTGFGGITAVYSDDVEKMVGFIRYNYPLVHLSGSNKDGTWSLHAGCGNRNGQDGCNAICKTLGHIGVTSNWDVKCGEGYPTKYESIASDCVYKKGPVDSRNNDWSYTGTTKSCPNPMYYCDCEGSIQLIFWYNVNYEGSFALVSWNISRIK